MDEFKIINDNRSDCDGKSGIIGNRPLRPRREIIIEDLQTEFDKQLDKIALINDFMSLFSKRHEIRDDLTVLKKRTMELKTFLADARQSINFFKTTQVPETHLLIDKMREQHLKMLRILENTDESIPPSLPSRQVLSTITYRDENNYNINTATSNLITPNSGPAVSKFNTLTPKMHQSPFKIRADPSMALKLNKQFEVHINPDEFDKIPKYLKGRDTFDELSTFLQTVIVKCFMDKYTLLHRDRETVLHPNQMQRWKMYRSQMEYFPGEMFITEGDIAQLIDRMMDKKMSNRISMLRHIHVIQEMRKGSATCYIWKVNK